MIVMINGSFGVGKSTVAKLLRKALAGSVVYDPEWAGMILMRLPKWIKLKGSGTDDFQDIVLWRRLAVAGIRLFGLFASGPVIVPMAFSRHDYFDEVLAGIKRDDNDLRMFCLKASLPTIKKRLTERRGNIDGQGTRWLAQRIEECAVAHRDPHFGEPVDTESRSALEAVKYIVGRLEGQ